ncbi:hypothetical protein A2U01_0115117, partial [Trifolium medium]|nr:hypothetical protein [Trifolium medium]
VSEANNKVNFVSNNLEAAEKKYKEAKEKLEGELKGLKES